MDEDLNFNTYLFLSPNKLIISVYQKSNFVNIYEQEITIQNKNNYINLDLLKSFLDKNIFEIEKKLKQFIKKIDLLIDCEDFFPIQISIKKNNYGDDIIETNLRYLLNELKDDCKNTLQNNRIVHMIIDNYKIDNKDHSKLPNNIMRCESLSIDVSFLCLSNNFVKNLEIILKKYQISLGCIVEEKYVKKFFHQKGENPDLFQMTKQIIEGSNVNEVILVPKSIKNKGFFEKFFQLFS